MVREINLPSYDTTEVMAVCLHGASVKVVAVVQGMPAKVRPTYILMVTFECIGKIQ